MSRNLIGRAAAAAAVVGTAFALAGCGEQIAEEVVERQVEGALGTAGGDVEIDIDEEGESGTITLGGEDGDATLSFGSSDLPEGFPAELVPDGATIESATTIASGDGGMDSVSFTSDRDLDEMFQFYLDAWPSIGYEVQQQTRNTSGDTASFSMAAGTETSTASVTGITQDDGTFTYTVLLIRNASE